MAKSSKSKKPKKADHPIEKTAKPIRIADLEMVEDAHFFRTYANFMRGINSPYDITIFFGQLDQPLSIRAEDPRIRMKGSITMSVDVAERLVGLLQMQLREFEPLTEGVPPAEVAK